VVLTKSNLPTTYLDDSGSEEDFAEYDIQITEKSKVVLIDVLVNLALLLSVLSSAAPHKDVLRDWCPYFSKMLSSTLGCSEVANASNVCGVSVHFSIHCASELAVRSSGYASRKSVCPCWAAVYGQF
jgi:hypothetical protein